MVWLHENIQITELPEDCVGFVYLITNNVSGRKYIGKKLAKFSKTTYRVVKLKNGNKKKKRIRSKIDSLMPQTKSPTLTIGALTNPLTDC